MDDTVIVGVDGSPSAFAAVETAAHEAVLRGAELRIVHAFSHSDDLNPMVHGVLARAEQQAHDQVPGLEVTRTVASGETLAVLRNESRHAVLAVVGGRGRTRFGDLLLGSTVVQLAAHAHCPVMAVRGRPEPRGPVLLAVDGSPAGAAAGEFAFAEAALRDAPLVALHVWNAWSEPTPYEGPADPLNVVVDLGRLLEKHQNRLEEAVAPWRAARPEVPVELRLVRSRVRHSLLDASGEARLVVVGARGHGGFTGMLLGSVSQALLHHADCPVVVVRGER